MNPHVSALRVRAALVAVLVVLASIPLLPGQEKPPGNTAAKHGPAWTQEEALAQLTLSPNDAYLQYVALQLGRREGMAAQTADQVQRLTQRQRLEFRNERTASVDLFSLFSGALAVQESLQLDAMRGERPNRRPPPGRPPEVKPQEKLPPGQQVVAVADLKGPEIKSHPWAEMLKGASPDVGRLGLCVPEDFYFIEFRSLTKLLEAMDVTDLWGTHLFNQANRDARGQRVGERLKEQLALETNPLLRPVYDLAVDEVAVAGSDLFLREGSDVTLLFHVKQAAVFKSRMDGFLAKAEKAGARKSSGESSGIPYVHLETPDRSVCVYSAYPADDLHLRSNSKVALERVLQAIAGTGVRRLGSTDEFRYVRTLMPRGAKEEDGFIYLSDPFVRRLMGPTVKLTERRRMLCYNHLRMIGHASLLYRTEHGQVPASLEALDQAKCLPGAFNAGIYTCPDGGKYSLTADGTTGTCSHHGHAGFLTPCCETPVAKVSGEEADEYNQFLAEYNQYWRTFFDPIALRIQVTPQHYRVETIVLPLIDNSIYTALARALGGPTEPLDALPVPKRNIFSVALKLNHQDLLADAGLIEASAPQVPSRAEVAASGNNLRQFALALHNYHDTWGQLPAPASRDKNGKPLLSWRVHILPYLEQDSLYKEFHLDEPWDSEHNKKLIARMPKIYHAPGSKAAEGKTTYLAPVGEATVFPPREKGVRIADIADGTSNTIMLVDADDDHAVIWTKPDDLAYDPKDPKKGLGGRWDEGFVVAFVDGSVQLISKMIAKEKLHAAFTRAGGEVVDLSNDARSIPSGRGSDPDFARYEERLHLKELLKKGVGDQVGLHVYDAVPLFDFNLPQFLGLAMGSFNGRGGLLGSPGTTELGISFLIASLNAPTYLAVPVKDAKVVDAFLERLDGLLAAEVPKTPSRMGPMDFVTEFYKTPRGSGLTIRAVSIQIGPVKWRLFWARIGRGLYVASKPFILDDLAALDDGQPKTDAGPSGHAMVRVRARNWDRVLPDYRLSWAEGSRSACLNNLSSLRNAGRAVVAAAAGGDASEESLGQAARREADRTYGVHFFCPEDGHYLLSADG